MIKKRACLSIRKPVFKTSDIVNLKKKNKHLFALKDYQVDVDILRNALTVFPETKLTGCLCLHQFSLCWSHSK